MAFLVLETDKTTEVDYSEKVIYLDQKFYELIFLNKDLLKQDSDLRKVVLLGYKDEPHIVLNKSLDKLMEDINKIFNMRRLYHQQLDDLIRVIEETKIKDKHLAFSGDMYPELNK